MAEAQRSVPLDGDIGVVNVACLDLMLIEMVPMAQRVSEQILREQAARINPRSKIRAGKDYSKVETEEIKEAASYRLEGLGHRVGISIVESLSQSSPLPTLLTSRASASSAPDPSAYLDTIKFICKDLWSAVFRKQIDNLKTNHRGTFVLVDHRFEPLRRCSLEVGKQDEAKVRAMPFLSFPQGLVRGALTGLGLDSDVKIEIGNPGIPSILITIKVGTARGQ